MASSSEAQKKPVVAVAVATAHVIVSTEVAGSRAPLLAQMEGAIPKLAATGRLDRVTEFEPTQVRLLLQAPAQAQTPIVDIDVKKLEDEKLRPLMRSMHLRGLSNGMKHLDALRRISQQEDDGLLRFSLVVEDDVLFGEGMPAAVAAAAASAPEDADIVFLGLPSSRPSMPTGGQAVFDDPLEVFKDHLLPSCDSYLVTVAGARKLVAAFLPCRFPAAGQLTYLFRKGVAKAYLAVPNAFVDGSKVGIVTSSIETNNRLLWNQGYCQMDALVRGQPSQEYTAEAQATFEALWESQPFKEHPDMIVLHADHHLRSGRVAEAKDAFAKALALYERDGCITNQGSDWLTRYMNLHGLLQQDLPEKRVEQLGAK